MPKFISFRKRRESQPFRERISRLKHTSWPDLETVTEGYFRANQAGYDFFDFGAFMGYLPPTLTQNTALFPANSRTAVVVSSYEQNRRLVPACPNLEIILQVAVCGYLVMVIQNLWVCRCAINLAMGGFRIGVTFSF